MIDVKSFIPIDVNEIGYHSILLDIELKGKDIKPYAIQTFKIIDYSDKKIHSDYFISTIKKEYLTIKNKHSFVIPVHFNIQKQH